MLVSAAASAARVITAAGHPAAPHARVAEVAGEGSWALGNDNWGGSRLSVVGSPERHGVTESHRKGIEFFDLVMPDLEAVRLP